METMRRGVQWFMSVVVIWLATPVLAVVGDHFDIAEIDDTPRIRDIEYPD